MTADTVTTDWESLVQAQTERQAEASRCTALAGYGQPMDPAMWPIIERFWALGIPTAGSCQGHQISETSWSETFVSVDLWGASPSVIQRRHQIVLALVDQRPVAGAEIHVTATSVYCTYRNWVGQHRTMSQKWLLGLQAIIEALDTAGRYCVEHEPAWEPWSGPAPGVPDAVDPVRLGTEEWHAFLRGLDRPTWTCVTDRLIGRSWEQTAQDNGMSIEQAKAQWEKVWQNWLDQQDRASTPLSASAANK